MTDGYELTNDRYCQGLILSGFDIASQPTLPKGENTWGFYNSLGTGGSQDRHRLCDCLRHRLGLHLDADHWRVSELQQVFLHPLGALMQIAQHCFMEAPVLLPGALHSNFIAWP